MPYAAHKKRDANRRAYLARSDETKEKIKAARAKARELDDRQFVAIDSEGGNFGEPIEHDDRKFQPHKTFLWGAGSCDGSPDWLCLGRPLSSVEIWRWLTDLPEVFGKRTIFVSFAFGYDVGQILADLPYGRALELQRNGYYDDAAGEFRPSKGGQRQMVIHNGYGFQYLKSKVFSIWRFKPGEPTHVAVLDRWGEPKFRRDEKTGDEFQLMKVNAEANIRIFDTFGYFQSSFVEAASKMPDVASPEEMDIIKRGKSDRGKFDLSQLDMIKTYTACELRVLARMMACLRDAMRSENINVKSWHGAGSIASALLKREGVRAHIGKVEADNLPPPQIAAHHAYFGGRIELLQQGNTREPLWGYDLASAYPAAQAGLPSMDGGRFETIALPRREQIEATSRLSMVRLRTKKLPAGAPFYPLPYRVPCNPGAGAILFPREVYGWYMRDEVVAAYDWIDQFGGQIEALEMQAFVPGSDAAPFEFLRHLFDYRAGLVAQAKQTGKPDVREKVVKLGINSCYGKTAQRVGGRGEPPPYASPWHAAAITAWTRAQMTRAALTDPGAIVMFATDGIVSTRRLPLDIPAVKTLGAWEESEHPEGGIYIQSGVYAYSSAGKGGVEWSAKTRGFRPFNIDRPVIEILRDEIPRYWKRDAAAYEFPYQNYMTLGASVASKDLWRFAGYWAISTRDLKLGDPGVKRTLDCGKALKRARAGRLVKTLPSLRNVTLLDEDGFMIMSAPSAPEWLDDVFAFEMAIEDEQEAILAGMS